MTKTLPAQPDIEWLKKTAKQQLKELRIAEPAAKLHEAQLAVARDYGFASWRALKAHVDKVSLDGQIGAIIRQAPANFPWGLREMNVEDLDGHRLRLGSEATGPVDNVALNEAP
jgi:hypothetical protein